MHRILIIFFILNIYNITQASIKENIISKLQQTKSLSFNFKQTIGKKVENGNCIIKYPKKIYCEYENLNKKILVSNGKSLVIKNRNSGTYYIYSLKKTPLEFLLDKDYLIKKIQVLKFRNINKKYINITLFENDNEINMFFSKKTYDLIGWQTEDIYHNLTITFISSLKLNEKINDSVFNLPARD